MRFKARRGQLVSLDAALACLVLLLAVASAAAVLSRKPPVQEPPRGDPALAALLSDPCFINALYARDNTTLRGYLESLGSPARLIVVDASTQEVLLDVSVGEPFGVAGATMLTGVNGTFRPVYVYLAVGVVRG